MNTRFLSARRFPGAMALGRVYAGRRHYTMPLRAIIRERWPVWTRSGKIRAFRDQRRAFYLGILLAQRATARLVTYFRL